MSNDGMLLLKGKYIDTRVTARKFTKPPKPRLTVDGYTKRSGSPTAIMVTIGNDKRWRRVYVWQFSNSPTLFIRLKGVAVIINY